MAGWQWANFVLLVIGLTYLVRKNLPPLLRARTEGIQQGMREAAKMKQEAEVRAAEMDRRLAGISQEIEALRSQVHESMEREGSRIKQDTERMVRRIHEQAQQEIAFMTKGALQELKRYSAELSLDLARKRIAERMNPDTQHRLTQAFVSSLQDGDSSASRAGRIPGGNGAGQ